MNNIQMPGTGQMDPVMRQRLGEDTGDNSAKKNVYNYSPGQNWERHGWAGGKRGSSEEEEEEEEEDEEEEEEEGERASFQTCWHSAGSPMDHIPSICILALCSTGGRILSIKEWSLLHRAHRTATRYKWLPLISIYGSKNRCLE